MKPTTAPIAALAALLLAQPAAAQVRTYWIDESLDFSGNGCENADLNNVTSYLEARLTANGWSGERWVDANAWPQDFQEASFVPGGIDYAAADSKTLSVHAGHGNVGLLAWGFPSNNTCMVSMPAQTRLGTGWGNASAYGMYLDSCVMRLDMMISAVGAQQVYQQFGYHNSPVIFDGQPGEFFDDTATLRNEQAWIDRMDDKPGFFFGWNSPVALTFGPTAAQCAAFQTNARLKGGVLVGPSPEPNGYWCAIWRDNGGC